MVHGPNKLQVRRKVVAMLRDTGPNPDGKSSHIPIERAIQLFVEAQRQKAASAPAAQGSP